MHTGCVQIDCAKSGCISCRSVIDVNDFMFFLRIAIMILILFGQHKRIIITILMVFSQHKHITITVLMVVGPHKRIAIKILMVCGHGLWNVDKCTWEYVIHMYNESMTYWCFQELL